MKYLHFWLRFARHAPQGPLATKAGIVTNPVRVLPILSARLVPSISPSTEGREMNSSWIKSLLVTMPLSAVLTLSGCGSSPTAPSVSPPSSPPSTAESSVVAMPAAATILPGQSQQFVAQVSGLSDKTVTWQVEGSGGGTITSTGLYTAPSATGVYTVIATSSAGANYSAAALVLVTAKPSPFSPTGNLVYGREFHTATLLAARGRRS